MLEMIVAKTLEENLDATEKPANKGGKLSKQPKLAPLAMLEGRGACLSF
jgi:hypothetical protein